MGLNRTALMFAVAVCLFSPAAGAEDSETLTCGMPVTSDLESGDTISFRLDQAPDRVLVEAIDISGQLGLLKLAVTEEPGTATCSGTLPVDNPIDEIEISDCIANHPDDRLGRVTVTMNVVSATAGNCGKPLLCGIPQSGRLDVLGKVVAYTFPVASGGDEVTLSLRSAMSGPPTLRLRVFDPQGMPVDGGDSCEGPLTIQPTQTGLYTVLVSACAKPVTTAYMIALEPLNCPVSLEVGSVNGAPGRQVGVGVTLHAPAYRVAATQTDFTFRPETPIRARASGTPDCTVNPDINKNASFVFQPQGCVGHDCNGVRAIVLGLGNSDPIGDGSTLFTCTAAISTDAANGSYPLTCVNAGASNPLGDGLPTTCTSGAIEVGAAACPGDCDGNRQVSVDELVKGVNVALGAIPIDECPAFDVDDDGHVSVDELVGGVNSALRGCSTAAAISESKANPGGPAQPHE